MTFLFTTERLQVRPLNIGDIVALHKMHSNPKVMQYTDSTTNSIEEERVNLKKILDCYEKPNNDYWIWGVERKSNNELIGTCAMLKSKIADSDFPKDEIGYRFLEDCWGNGFGNEITKGLLNYAFTQCGKTEIVAEVDELNVASIKILEKHLIFVKAYYSEEYKSNDRKYRIDKTTFLSRNQEQ
ncbi:MAG: GNAT family N-acetyltransferase [Crocinitomix sp.]|nr:GNAT family N-acetyltransferase [Crocinitomix sp.]